MITRVVCAAVVSPIHPYAYALCCRDCSRRDSQPHEQVRFKKPPAKHGEHGWRCEYRIERKVSSND